MLTKLKTHEGRDEPVCSNVRLVTDNDHAYRVDASNLGATFRAACARGGCIGGGLHQRRRSEVVAAMEAVSAVEGWKGFCGCMPSGCDGFMIGVDDKVAI